MSSSHTQGLFVCHYLKDMNEEEFKKMKTFLYKAELLNENENFNKEEKYIMFQTSFLFKIHLIFY